MKVIGLILNISVENIEDCYIFYKDILNFTNIFEINNVTHREIIFHNPKLSNHLFIRVRQQNSKSYIKPSADHLLIFYLNSEKLFEELTSKFNQIGIKEVKSINPYWDKSAKTFLGPSDYRIVLHPGSYHGYKARVARPTANIDKIKRFYLSELFFNQIGEFKEHEGFDGIILGMDKLDCHLEMTYQHGHNKTELHPSGYSIELITYSDHDQMQVLHDPDNYKIFVNLPFRSAQ